MERIKLSQADRAFFALVSEAIFTNPFGQRRQQLDREILGISKGAKSGNIVYKVIERVNRKLSALDQD